MMHEASAAAASSDNFWSVVVLIFIFGGGILEAIGGYFGVGLSSLRRRSKLRHKRKLELLRAQARLEEARTVAAVMPAAVAVPGACQHRKVEAVRDVPTGDVLAWLCLNPLCGKQLPVTFGQYSGE